MKVDVSEVKSYRECPRKHQLNSRNRFHLRPHVVDPNLVFGTIFHEALHAMYMGTPIDSILTAGESSVSGMQTPDAAKYVRMFRKMIEGYYEGPYQTDKERYEVVDIEKSFCFPGIVDPETGEVLVEFCGSIDMICVDKQTNKLVGFEHKTGKNFRPAIYNMVDEQPRMYSIALKKILEDYHTKGKFLDVNETGPIFLNQVKKLVTKFDYLRAACSYSDKNLEKFYTGFQTTSMDIYNNKSTTPMPGFMKCSMCDFSDICQFYDYGDIELEEVLDEFSEEFKVRDQDHLEEKPERLLVKKDD